MVNGMSDSIHYVQSTSILTLPVANGKSRFLHRVTFELIISKRLKAQVNYHFTLVEVFEIVKQK